ncbi:HAMP domain-containing sensor histidine kinase [Streptomyces sp. NPDC097704]|uniref:HAMP domain-containing sensor histidine kinase n=1 Tax=Streptomyces sp. NPDC097704 TaxID=3157101 RepID=UPI00332C4076
MPAKDGDYEWRVMALTRPAQVFPPERAEDRGSVVVATFLDEVDRTVTKTRNLSLTMGAALLVLLAVAGWFAVRSGLRPLTRIEETATAITAGDYSHRVPELAAPHTEVGHLTACLNQMLDRIDTAFQARAEAEARTRRFFADAGHELRTPLVGIKGYTDLYRMGALPTREDVDQTMTRIAAESERLTRLVEEMFLLARLDEDAVCAREPALALDLAPMDLRTLAADALHDVRALDATRPVTLTGPRRRKTRHRPRRRPRPRHRPQRPAHPGHRPRPGLHVPHRTAAARRVTAGSGRQRVRHRPCHLLRWVPKAVRRRDSGEPGGGRP